MRSQLTSLNADIQSRVTQLSTGTNHSLAEALNRTPNFSGQAEGWHDTSARTFTAAAILETGTGSTSGGAPTWTGEFPGQLATTTKIDYTPESASKQYREIRIRRSEDGDQSVPLAMVFMQEDDSSVTGGQTLSLAAGQTLSSSTVTLEPYLAAENIAAAAAETSASAGKTATVIDIVPDASMYNTDGSAKLGDLVPSAKTDSTEQHFVTPKKTTEISDDSIVLQATGVSAADFESTAPALPRVSWIGGLPAGTDKTKRKVSRTTAAHTVVKLKPQNGTGVVMNVWVVWAHPIVYWDVQNYTLAGTKIANMVRMLHLFRQANSLFLKSHFEA